MESEEVSNPIGPGGYVSEDEVEDELQPLTNADFRKLMMTPAARTQRSSTDTKITKLRLENDTEAMRARREKKMRYAKLRKIQEEREKELAAKYRDRAAERRQTQEGEYQPNDMQSTTADYKAVAPTANVQADNFTERRKQIIQDSKYLGGDMEHTHLVKGLDYALLEKVRGEISVKQQEEVVFEKALKPGVVEEELDTEEKFKTKLGRNLNRIIHGFRSTKIERNELFLPRRMCYVIDLDEEADTDIPTTVIRSKADCPSLESATTLTINEKIIQKISEIRMYMRHGRKEKRRLKKAKLKDEGKGDAKLQEESIYSEIGDYRPSARSSRDRRHDNRRTDNNYFDDSQLKQEQRDDRPKYSAKDLVKNINDRYGSSQKDNWSRDEGSEKQPTGRKKEESKLLKKLEKYGVQGYNECYPGMAETHDAIADSDDEADYTQMDMGNKKGPLSRWDFDNAEEYGKYMDRKEAMPKAAFQYGVKMSDGRRTRRTAPKDEKRELDREWQQIQNLITKRKGGSDSGSSSWKKPKY